VPSSFLGVSGVADPPTAGWSAQAARGRLAERAKDRPCASGQPLTNVQDPSVEVPITGRLSPAARFVEALILPLAMFVLAWPRPDAPPPPLLAPT
jgi:hypothetical protein